MYVLEHQGHVLRVHVRQKSSAPIDGGAARSRIKAFSQKSRKRLLELFNRLEISGRRTTFLTLTTAEPMPAFQATTAFRRFNERIRRAFPDCPFIWRKELPARGAWPYPLILFDFSYVPPAQIQRAWE